MQSELGTLLELQQKDMGIQEAERRIDHLNQRTAQVKQLLGQTIERHQKLHDLFEAQKIVGRKLTEEVDHLDDHIREQERKLAEDIVSFKEIDQIKESIDHGHQHIETLEDQAIGVLNEIEDQTEVVQQKDVAFAKRKSELEAELADFSNEIDELRAHMASLHGERAELWDNLPHHLKSTYERLLASVDQPIVPVKGQNCGGCHLQLSSQLIQEVRLGTDLIHCEHCSRILYSA